MSMTATTETEVPTPSNEVANEIPMVPTERERAFELIQRQASALAKSQIVPKAYQGNLPNCMIALELASRIGSTPMIVMQNLHVIQGKPSFSAQFLIACLNKCGRFTPLRYRIEGEGMEMSCVAYAHDKETGELYEGPPVTMKMAKAEGWIDKSQSKWQTMPDLMIRYRAAAFFARTTAPEVAMGLHTAEEMRDIGPSPAMPQREESAMDRLDNALDVTPEAESDVPTSDPEPGTTGTFSGDGNPAPGESESGDVDPEDAAFGLGGAPE